MSLSISAEQVAALRVQRFYLLDLVRRLDLLIGSKRIQAGLLSSVQDDPVLSALDLRRAWHAANYGVAFSEFLVSYRDDQAKLLTSVSTALEVFSK